MTNEEAEGIILNDKKQAKKAKSDIDSKIETWLNEYDGEPYGTEAKGRSAIVVKDIKKAVESFLPNAVEPFVSKNRLVKLEGITADDVKSAKMHEMLLNYQFVRKFDRVNFIHEMFKVSATEGTVNIKVGWELEEEETSEKFNGINEEQLGMFESEGLELSKITDNEDGTYDVVAVNRKTIENKPTAEIIRNGRFYPDPSADCIDNCSFVAYDYEDTIGNLKKSGKFDEEDFEDCIKRLADDSTLESSRRTKLQEQGTDSDYESMSKPNKKVTVTEYWGNLDMNDDGIAEPIFATLINNKVVEVIDNPNPDKSLPFVSIQFSKVPFAFWGNAMAEFISDNQKVRTSLMRGFIDSVAISNNGKKFVKKGSLDPMNKRKYENNLSGVIEVNGDRSDMWDGEYNQISPSMFNLYELIQQETEGLSGINRTMSGVDSRGLNDSATGATIQQNMSQKRVIDIVRRHSEGLKKLFRKWIALNKEFLSDDEVMRISGQYIPFKRDDIDGSFDIDISFNVDGVTEAKVNQMTMLMQQVGGLSSVASIPPEFFNLMLSRMADEWGYADIAQMLEKPQPPQEPDEMTIRNAEAEVSEKESKAELNKAKAIQAMSDSNVKSVSAEYKALGLDKPTR